MSNKSERVGRRWFRLLANLAMTLLLIMDPISFLARSIDWLWSPEINSPLLDGWNMHLTVLLHKAAVLVYAISGVFCFIGLMFAWMQYIIVQPKVCPFEINEAQTIDCAAVSLWLLLLSKVASPESWFNSGWAYLFMFICLPSVFAIRLLIIDTWHQLSSDETLAGSNA